MREMLKTDSMTSPASSERRTFLFLSSSGSSSTTTASVEGEGSVGKASGPFKSKALHLRWGLRTKWTLLAG